MALREFPGQGLKESAGQLFCGPCKETLPNIKGSIRDHVGRKKHTDNLQKYVEKHGDDEEVKELLSEHFKANPDETGTRGSDGKRSAARPPEGSTLFARNPFPYDVPAGTEHWVFWMASPESEWPEARITAGIAAAVDEKGGGQFVWYPNPKMSIGDPRLHHVQVFFKPDAASTPR